MGPFQTDGSSPRRGQKPKAEHRYVRTCHTHSFWCGQATLKNTTCRTSRTDTARTRINLFPRHATFDICDITRDTGANCPRFTSSTDCFERLPPGETSHRVTCLFGFPISILVLFTAFWKILVLGKNQSYQTVDFYAKSYFRKFFFIRSGLQSEHFAHLFALHRSTCSVQFCTFK